METKPPKELFANGGGEPLVPPPCALAHYFVQLYGPDAVGAEVIQRVVEYCPVE